MTKEIYENSVLDESTDNIEEQEAGFCEDAARNVIGVITDCLTLNIREKPSKDSRVVTVVTCLDELEIDMGDSNDLHCCRHRRILYEEICSRQAVRRKRYG